MNIDSDVPFYSNTPDDTHCFQACLKMILKYQWPDHDYSWEILDKITGKENDLGTWPMTGIIWMKQKGFDVVNIESFDYERFAINGEVYIEEEFGEEVLQSVKEDSNIALAQKHAKEFVRLINTEKHIPDIQEIVTLIKKGYLIIVNVNVDSLNNRKGYTGHFVLLKGLGKENFILHDPGLPAYKNRKVHFELFEKAWAYPNEKAKNIMAFKLEKL